MKKLFSFALIILTFLTTSACSDEKESANKISDIGLRVCFTTFRSASTLKSATTLTQQTPESYKIALKSAKLLGISGTANVELFNAPNLSSSLTFDFLDEATVHSLLQGTQIPEGDYNGIEIEIYYLQMRIDIASVDRGIEKRDIRIYLSDDAETEGGLHQPGDLTQIESGVEVGWLLGEGQEPNMDPVSPRVNAYTQLGDGVNWYNFAGKSGQNYGPFGDVNFMNLAPHPIYKTTIPFVLPSTSTTNLFLNFNVQGCWQFEDKSPDGAFGAADLDPLDPTEWNMAIPVMTVSAN